MNSTKNRRIFRYRLSPETSGYTLVQLQLHVKYGLERIEMKFNKKRTAYTSNSELVIEIR